MQLNKNTLLLLFLLLLLSTITTAQNITGIWEGEVSQIQSNDIYTYTLELTQNGKSLSGEATSVAPSGHSATFVVSGVITEEGITLQEIKQLSPVSPKWCMKFIQMNDISATTLAGRWSADGCADGGLSLKKVVNAPTIDKPWLGEWTGSLKQSDRDYGFYFEMNLLPDHTGTSYIVSEGNGGSALHHLTWQYDEEKDKLSFEESHVDSKSVSDWKWCIKDGELDFVDLGSSYFLLGDWAGYIENSDNAKGACAPGKISLEKTIVEKIETKVIKEEKKPYEIKNHRKVKIGRTIKVKSNKLKIRVWDNGTVDGDIATIFLNGSEIFSQYKVTKHKRGVPVTIKNKDNILILHAEDLGDISPNTVAVSIDDGEREQVVIVSSNLEDSGAILIRQFDKNE